MRENNRKPIEKCRKKLPQFTTMNVIDGQAGLVIYSSLIFYSLTINNILNIIVLLILAGVSIAMLTGENGVLTKATEAKNQNEIATEKEEIKMAYAAAKANKVDKVSEAVIADELNSELDKLNSKGEASGSGTLTVTYPNGHKYKINQSTGTITGPEDGSSSVDDEVGLSGEGTEENPYKVSSIEDLVTFSNQVNQGDDFTGKYIELDRDLDFLDDESYIDSSRIDMGDLNNDGKTESLKTELTTGDGFIPIGAYEPFFGEFNGIGKKIKNLTASLDSVCSLFGINNGRIINLTIDSINVNSESNGYVSGICMENYGDIYNCNIVGNIVLQNTSEFGGIAYENSGNIYNCKNEANINAKYTEAMYAITSGICAKNKDIGEIIYCSNSGNISMEYIGDNNYIRTRSRGAYMLCISGITEENSGVIAGTSNTGDLKSINGAEGYSIAGIALDNSGTVTICYNTGKLQGTVLDESSFSYEWCGGIVVDNYTETPKSIYSCYNVGNIESGNAENYIGGAICTRSNSIAIENCYYLSGTCESGIGEDYNENGGEIKIFEKTEEEMKSDDFIITLNSKNGSLPLYFVKDSNTNNGYPIIKCDIDPDSL